jgi:hypothetical protein
VSHIADSEVLMKMRLVLVTAALSLIAVACGGGGAGPEGVASLSAPDSATTVPAPDGSTGGDSTDGDAEGEVDTEQALLDFAECMREHGIDIEDPSFSGDGGGFIRIGPPPGDGAGDTPDADVEAMQAAQEACSEHLEGIAQEFGEIDPTERQDQALEFAQCMRDHGVDMPDPDFSDVGPEFSSEDGEGEAPSGPFGDLDPEDPAFQAALEECGGIFGGALGGPGGPGGAGGADATDPDEQ